MVVRYLCRCATCGKEHTLRISLGHNPVQEHTFRCVECGEDATIEVTLRPERVGCDIVCTSNCAPGTTEGVVVNLHPSFPISQADLHRDKAFPWMEHVRDVGQIQSALLPNFQGFRSLDEAMEYAKGVKPLGELWPLLKRAWSLTRNGRDDLAEPILMDYKVHGYSEGPRLKNVLFHFCSTILGPVRHALFSDARQWTERIAHDHQTEFQRFLAYFRTSFPDHLDRYLDVFQEYFRDLSEYSQTLLMCQYRLPLPSDAVATSVAFPRTKMFYGNAFEAHTSNVVTLACLNNVGSGRAFDQFESMDLRKYLTIDKAKRSNPFAATKAYAGLSDGVDTALRNASHHGAIKLDRQTGVLSYRSGGTGAMRQMKYVQYLHTCNELFLRIVALLMLELTLEQA